MSWPRNDCHFYRPIKFKWPQICARSLIITNRLDFKMFVNKADFFLNKDKNCNLFFFPIKSFHPKPMKWRMKRNMATFQWYLIDFGGTPCCWEAAPNTKSTVKSRTWHLQKQPPVVTEIRIYLEISTPNWHDHNWQTLSVTVYPSVQCHERWVNAVPPPK